jgi:hypothetical protein
MVEELFKQYPEQKGLADTEHAREVERAKGYRGSCGVLLSDASSFMTGADLRMDGGHSAW